MKRSSFAPLAAASAAALILALGSSDAAARRDSEPRLSRATDLDTAPEGGGGILDPFLQAPPPTSEDVLVSRLVEMGVDEQAAWTVVGDLAALQASGAGADVTDGAVSSLVDGETASELARAYLRREPIATFGWDLAADVQSRIVELQAAGVGPEEASWLARQEQAARLAGEDVSTRIQASLDVLDRDDETRTRLVQVFSRKGDHDEAGWGQQAVTMPGLGDRLMPPVTPNAACASCPNANFGTFAPNGNWQTHASTIGAADCRVYRFSVVANHSYRFTFCEAGGTATFDTLLESSTYQNQICAAGPTGVNCGGVLDRLDYTAPYSGFFFLKVRNPTLAAGSYTLAFRDTTARCNNCPAFDYGPFTPTAVYQQHSDTLRALECRIYKFNLAANHQYRFTLCSPDSSGMATGASSTIPSSTLTLRDASCLNPATTGPSPCPELNFTAPTSGVFYLTVAGQTISDTGSYTLAYRDLVRCAACPAYDFGVFTPTTTWQSHTSSIAADKCKLYRFQVTAGKTYLFSTCPTDANGFATGGNTAFDSVLEAYNSACVLLGQNDNGGCGAPANASQLSVTPIYSGSLYVRVRGATPAANGAYSLAYRDAAAQCKSCPQFDAALANPTPVYQQMPGAIEPNGCRIYRVYLTAGNAYRFTTCPTDSSAVASGGTATFDTILDVLSATCTALGTNDDSGCGFLRSELDHLAVTTGFHYVRVRGFNAASGTFTLAYRQLGGTCTTCPSFNFGTFAPSQFWQTHSATVDPEGCRVYRFTLTAGQEYEFSLCQGGGTTNGNNLRVLAKDPNCANLVSLAPACGVDEDFRFLATTSGFHYVTVDGDAPLDGGAYTLAYRDRTAACDSDCPAFNYGTFTPTQAVNTHSDSVDAGGCDKTYRFNVFTGVTYHFSTCPPGSASFNSALEGLDGGCAPIVGVTNNNACVDDATIDYTATGDGFVYIRVYDEVAGAGGAYTLAYWRDPDCTFTEVMCTDVDDNDCDGLVDCADSDCNGNAACEAGNCGDGLDNDGDGAIDCIDDECDGDGNCPEDCNNGIDDDGDGNVDTNDESCLCTDGIDNDFGGIADCGDPECVGIQGC